MSARKDGTPRSPLRRSTTSTVAGVHHEPLSRPRRLGADCRGTRGCRDNVLMAELGSHKVVVIGGGFGGLQAATHLASAPVDLTLVDRRNFHMFQPLSYQVATGALAPEEVCYPLRAIFKRRGNVRVVMAEVRDFDLEARELRVEPTGGESGPLSVSYDTLIVAGGSRYSYFGHDEWRKVAPEVKS